VGRLSRHQLEPHQRDDCRGSEEGDSIECDRDAGPEAGDDEARERGAADRRRVPGEREQGVRLLQERRRDGLRRHARRGREVEGDRGPVDSRQRSEVPHLRLAGDQQCRRPGLCERADDVRAHHHLVPRQPVRPDPADEQKEDERHLLRGENQAEVGLRPGQVEDGERQRNGRDRAARERDRATGEEEAELALAQRRCATPHACPSTA
jgi:hypothetical protein